MKEHELPFRFCPSCGSENLQFHRPLKMECADCGFTYYQNNAAATAVIVERGDSILMVERAREPGAGKLDLPGGFVDPGEGAMEGARREVMEELKLRLKHLRLVDSRPNRYPYKGTLYHTCDLFFAAEAEEGEPVLEKSELSGFRWIRAEDFNPDEVAFESVRLALSRYFRDRKVNSGG